MNAIAIRSATLLALTLAIGQITCFASTARANNPDDDVGRTCSLYERTRTVSIRDRPYDHPTFGVCLGNYLHADEHGLTSCRMFWRYVPDDDSASYPEPSCDDYDFLSPADDDVFENAKDAPAAPTCLVRQVSERAHERGEAGWYFLDPAPQYCTDAAPAAVVPTERPDFGWQIEMALQCKAAMSIDAAGHVDYVDDLAVCSQPKFPVVVTGIGNACQPKLNINSQSPTLEVGGDDCALGMCLTQPLAKTTCTQRADAPPLCSVHQTACTCRCAGDGPGPFCACPDGFSCQPLLTDYAATPELAGSYCVPPS
jgi:hypothetical protein